MKKNKKKSLRLGTETVRQLTEVTEVSGGAGYHVPTENTCYKSCTRPQTDCH